DDPDPIPPADAPPQLNNRLEAGKGLHGNLNPLRDLFRKKLRERALLNRFLGAQEDSRPASPSHTLPRRAPADTTEWSSHARSCTRWIDARRVQRVFARSW